MGKFSWAKVVKRFGIMIHPYGKSHHAHDYEIIADMCGTTPDRVYKIAHGSSIRSFADSATLTELKRRKIVLG
jgi:hypothetical protein